MSGTLIAASMPGISASQAIRHGRESQLTSGQCTELAMCKAVSIPNPTLLKAMMSPFPGCLPMIGFVSMHPAHRERASAVLCASANRIPAMAASPTHHFQSVYQCLGLSFHLCCACAPPFVSKRTTSSVPKRLRGVMVSSTANLLPVDVGSGRGRIGFWIRSQFVCFQRPAG